MKIRWLARVLVLTVVAIPLFACAAAEVPEEPTEEVSSAAQGPVMPPGCHSIIWHNGSCVGRNSILQFLSVACGHLGGYASVPTYMSESCGYKDYDETSFREEWTYKRGMIACCGLS